VQALAENWKDDPGTMPLLMTLAQSDEHGNLGQVAMQCLTQGWKDDPKLLPLLKTLAQSAKHCHVRETAMRGWTQRCQSDPDILPFLKKVAHSNDHWHVRAAAVEELARGWKYELDMFEFLRERAINDPYPLEGEENKRPNPRQTALEAIIEQYRDLPQTLPLLQDRAENDPDEKVREFANKKLEQIERPN
jgi:HEAT repeat protein